MENTTGGFQVSVKTFDEAYRFCQMISDADLCPDSYKPSTYLNKICGQNLEARKDPDNIKKAKEMSVNNIFIACSYGGTLGLNPFQSLQGIAMVNGKPSVYGDTLLALALPRCDDFQEWFDEQTGTAYCVLHRKGLQHPTQAKFSYQEAQRAGLTSKKGPWTQYPERMLKMRARGFAIRDAFPDVLSGIITREEAEDYPTQKTAELPQIPQQNISVSQQNVAVQQVPVSIPQQTVAQNAMVQPQMNFQNQQEQIINGNS